MKCVKRLTMVSLLVFIKSVCPLLIAAQSPYNLVPNYSFEYDSVCTNFNLYSPSPLWYSTSSATVGGNMSGCFSSCTPNPCCGVPINIYSEGYQYARTGNSYGNEFFIHQNRRGYLQSQLTSPLIAGQCYYAEFFVNLVNSASLLVNNVSMLVSVNAVSQGHTYLPIIANAQIEQYGNPIVKIDTLYWTKIAAIFVAQGGEKYVTIGNFKSDANTDTASSNIPFSYRDAQYNIDDVSVMAIDQDRFRLEADAGPDTTVAPGDSVFIGTLLGGTITTTWYDSSGNTIGTNVPGLYVSPTVSTYYVLEQSMCTYTSRDTVYVTVGALPVHLLSFTAKLSQSLILLQWHVEAEQNFSHYEIERSTNGRIFNKIGVRKAEGKREYDYIDNVELAGREIYYRLKLIEKDGKFEYTPVRHVKTSSEAFLKIFPNPAPNGVITIESNNESTAPQTITITDIVGKTLLSKDGWKGKTLQLQLPDVHGVYAITVTNTMTSQRQTAKLIIP